MSTIKVDTYLTRGGASEIAIDKLKGVTAAGSMLVVGEGGTTTTNLQQGLIKQWAKVDGQAATIDDSFNVSSVADSAVGQKLLTATNNMSSANYSVTSTTFFDGDIDAGLHSFVEGTFSTSQVLIKSLEYNSTNTGDCNSHFSQSTGDLA